MRNILPLQDIGELIHVHYIVTSFMNAFRSFRSCSDQKLEEHASESVDIALVSVILIYVLLGRSIFKS